MVPAFLMSLLVRQYLGDPKEFPGRYPHAWLIWEPGAWKAPEGPTKLTATVFAAVRPGEMRAAPGDALAFHLRLAYGSTELRLGRATENDIVINDATVSREHLVLTRSDEGVWSIAPASSSRTVLPNGRLLTGGEKFALVNGERFQLGDVVMSFLDSKAFFLRVESEARAALTKR